MAGGRFFSTGAAGGPGWSGMAFQQLHRGASLFGCMGSFCRVSPNSHTGLFSLDAIACLHFLFACCCAMGKLCSLIHALEAHGASPGSSSQEKPENVWLSSGAAAQARCSKNTFGRHRAAWPSQPRALRFFQDSLNGFEIHSGALGVGSIFDNCTFQWLVKHHLKDHTVFWQVLSLLEQEKWRRGATAARQARGNHIKAANERFSGQAKARAAAGEVHLRRRGSRPTAAKRGAPTKRKRQHRSAASQKKNGPAAAAELVAASKESQNLASAPAAPAPSTPAAKLVGTKINNRGGNTVTPASAAKQPAATTEQRCLPPEFKAGRASATKHAPPRKNARSREWVPVQVSAATGKPLLPLGC